MLLVLLCLMGGSALAQESVPLTEVAPQRELGLQLGYAWERDYEGYIHGGLGARLQFLQRVYSVFSVGLEASLYANAGSRMDVTWDGRDHHYSLKRSSLLRLGGVVRVGPELGMVRPAGLAGVAWYKGANSGFGVFVGAEVDVRVQERLSLVADVRVTDFWLSGLPPIFGSLGVGARLLW
jgi:hypothetical protein